MSDVNQYDDLKKIVKDEFKGVISVGGIDALIGVNDINKQIADSKFGYPYTAYATDNIGSGWTLTYNEGLTDYEATIYSNVELTPVEADFSGATWIYTRGAPGENGSGEPVGNLTGNLVLSNEGKLKDLVNDLYQESYFLQGTPTAYSWTKQSNKSLIDVTVNANAVNQGVALTYILKEDIAVSDVLYFQYYSSIPYTDFSTKFPFVAYVSGVGTVGTTVFVRQVQVGTWYLFEFSVTSTINASAGALLRIYNNVGSSYLNTLHEYTYSSAMITKSQYPLGFFDFKTFFDNNSIDLVPSITTVNAEGANRETINLIDTQYFITNGSPTTSEVTERENSSLIDVVFEANAINQGFIFVYEINRDIAIGETLYIQFYSSLNYADLNLKFSGTGYVFHPYRVSPSLTSLGTTSLNKEIAIEDYFLIELKFTTIQTVAANTLIRFYSNIRSAYINIEYSLLFSSIILNDSEKPLGYFNFANYNFNKRLDAKKIDCVGDSLTAASYPTYLQASLGTDYTVTNRGVGGEVVNTILARQGSIPMYIQNVTIPGDGSYVTVTPKSLYDDLAVDPLLQGSSDRINPCYIQGVECTLEWTGAIYRVKQNNIGDDRVLPTDAKCIISTRDTRDSKNSDCQIIFMGQNDGDPTGVEQALVDRFILATNFPTKREFIVITTHTDNCTLTLESLMQIEFGIRYFNLKEYLSNFAIYDAIKLGLLPDNGTYPTASDISAMSTRNCPPSLLNNPPSDLVHLNNVGNEVLANRLYQKMIELGIV